MHNGSMSVESVGCVADAVSDLLASTSDIDFHVENDGIGSYECHGYRGFHHGTNYAVADSDLTFKIDAPLIRRHKSSSAVKNEVEVIKRMSFHDWSDGCDGEHRGPCRAVCGEYMIELNVVDVEMEVIDGRLVFWVRFQ